jgi:hypothetical protein
MASQPAISTVTTALLGSAVRPKNRPAPNAVAIVHRGHPAQRTPSHHTSSGIVIVRSTAIAVDSTVGASANAAERMIASSVV